MLKLSVLPLRLQFQGEPTEWDLRVLRSVWGCALHQLDRALWERVFDGQHGGPDLNPAYVLRTTAIKNEIEWILFGEPAIRQLHVLQRAWDIAGAMGLGKQRQPFTVAKWTAMMPDGSQAEAVPSSAWRIGEALWPLGQEALCAPCVMEFREPLRILSSKKLNESPRLIDVIQALCRRLRSLSPNSHPDHLVQESFWCDLATRISCTANSWSSGYYGHWSSRQQNVVNQKGVCGRMEFPEGPGNLWPLLSSTCWTHIGKGYVLGMGRPQISSLC